MPRYLHIPHTPDTARTVKELTSATFADGTLTLNFANASSIEAGKPYLVKVAANTDLSAAPFTGAIVSKDAQPFTSTDVDFIPTLGATTIPDGDTKAVLFLAANNTLLNPLVVNCILQLPNTGGFSEYGADANGDGSVTVTDIGVIVDKILGTNASSRKMEQVLEPQ